MMKKPNKMKFGRTRQEQPKRNDPIQQNRGDFMRKVTNKSPTVTNKRNKGSEHP